MQMEVEGDTGSERKYLVFIVMSEMWMYALAREYKSQASFICWFKTSVSVLRAYD